MRPHVFIYILSSLICAISLVYDLFHLHYVELHFDYLLLIIVRSALLWCCFVITIYNHTQVNFVYLVESSRRVRSVPNQQFLALFLQAFYVWRKKGSVGGAGIMIICFLYTLAPSQP